MNKYTKPTISLLPLTSSTISASSCVVKGNDLDDLKEMLKLMGVTDISKAFGISEGCIFTVDAYCKFTSSIQVFNS